MGILARKGLLAGAAGALVLSILHARSFSADVFAPSGLIVWYLVSLLLGCLAGLLAGRLISRSPMPARLNSLAAYAGGALFGALAYFIQVYLFLMYIFSTTTWE